MGFCSEEEMGGSKRAHGLEKGMGGWKRAHGSEISDSNTTLTSINGLEMVLLYPSAGDWKKNLKKEEVKWLLSQISSSLHYKCKFFNAIHK